MGDKGAPHNTASVLPIKVSQVLGGLVTVLAADGRKADSLLVGIDLQSLYIFYFLLF